MPAGLFEMPTAEGRLMEEKDDGDTGAVREPVTPALRDFLEVVNVWINFLQLLRQVLGGLVLRLV
jgi:hypothetical protein